MLKYRQATIYFASGTGNSYRLAKWLQEFCLEKNIAAELIPINIADPKKEISASQNHLVALSFPTHGGLPPWSVIKFLFRMPKVKRTHFLCIPTRGSFYIGPVLIPGAACLASFLPAIILLFKGYYPRGAASFDMPLNVTSFHTSLASAHAKRVISNARQRFTEYFERYSRNNSLWLTWNNFYELVWTFFIVYFMPLFPILYLFVGRFFMGKIMFGSTRCLGCGSCAKTCPTGALIMRGRRKIKRPYWQYNCEHCLRCLNFCPNHAIEAGHSWAILLWYIGASVAFGGLLYTWLTGFIPQLLHVRNWWTVELLNMLFYYPAFLISYFLFFHLIRFKPMNIAVSYTSYSRFLSQYREPETNISDLIKRDSAAESSSA